MASSNACWGIEVGSAVVKAVKLTMHDDQVVVSDFAIVPHPKVLSMPGINHDDAMRVTLGTLASQYDLSGARIAVSVPGHAALARFAKLPPVEPKKVPDIVKFEAAQQIPFSLDEVEWDFQTFQSPDSPDIEVGIFAITKERIRQHLDLLSDVRIEPDIVTISPLAVYNAMAFDLEFTEKTVGTIILDIGTTSTDLIIAEAGRVWVRTFPLGGHHFTQALIERFGLSYPKAEKLKAEAHQSKHAKHVFQAMRGVFTDLVSDVQRSIGFYQSLHPEAKLTRLIGLGSTFRLPGLRKYLKQQLGVDVYKLDEFKRITIEGDRKDEFKAGSLQMATCVGLAIQGLDAQTIDANLIPVDNIRKAMWHRKTPIFAAAASMALIASGVMFYRPFVDSNAVKRARPGTVIQQASTQALRLGTLARERNVLGQTPSDYTAANMVALLDAPRVMEHLLADLSLVLADATERAPAVALSPGMEPHEGPAFEMVSFQTKFVGPGISMSRANKQVATRGRTNDPRDRSRRGRSSPTVQEEHLDTQRIAVTLRVTTTHPDPQRLAIETVRRWLRDNAVRQGVPYSIVASPDTLIKSITLAEITDEPGGLPTLNRGPRGRERNLRDVELGGHGFGGEGMILTGVQQPGGGEASRESQDLDKLAPIDKPADDGLPASTIELFWFVVVGEIDKEGA